MEENKRKKIEARLHQLFAQAEADKKEHVPTLNPFSGAQVIRRRKGKPDRNIS